MNSRIQWKGRLWLGVLCKPCKGSSCATGCAIVWTWERFGVQYHQIGGLPGLFGSCVYVWYTITWLMKSTTSLSDPRAIHNKSNAKQHISSWSKWSLDTWIPSVQFLDLQQFADRCLPPKDAMTPNCIRALCLRGIQWEQAQGRIQYCNRKEYLLEAASSPTVCGEGSPLVPPLHTLEISDILFAIAINKRKRI